MTVLPPLHKRNTGEIFWVEMQPLLKRRGYLLRPRYDPTWKPSWLQKRADGTMPSLVEVEDSIPGGGHLLDGVRAKDGLKVVFKIVSTSSEEIPISVLLSSSEMQSDPRNRSVPILDVVMIPANDERALLVMPQLLTLHRLPYRFLGELCETFLQLLEAFVFLHKQYIAHRDVCLANTAMDVTNVTPKGHHFEKWRTHDGVTYELEWNTRWSVQPNHYYIIDFGLSKRFESNNVKVAGLLGQDRTVPEMSGDTPYDPFKSDIFQLGNLFKGLIKTYVGFEVFNELADPYDVERSGNTPDSCRKLWNTAKPSLNA